MIEFNLKKFIYLSLLIILTTCLGTIIHEFGHFFSGKLMGYTPTLHYNKVTYENDTFYKYLESNGVSDNVYYDIQKEKTIRVACGPLTNMVIGILGLIIIAVYNRFKTIETMNVINWVSLLSSLLVLRQIVIGIFAVAFSLIGKSLSCDELSIDYFLKLKPFTVLTITSIISAILFYIIIRHFVPKFLRITFLSSILVGGISGYILWLFILGPILLP